MFCNVHTSWEQKTNPQHLSCCLYKNRVGNVGCAYLNLALMQDLSVVCLVLLLVQVELANGLQGLLCHVCNAVHPHFSHQHTLPRQQSLGEAQSIAHRPLWMADAKLADASLQRLCLSASARVPGIGTPGTHSPSNASKRCSKWCQEMQLLK